MIINYKLKEKALRDVKNKWLSLGLVLFIVGLITTVFACLYDILTIDLRKEIMLIEEAIYQLDLTTQEGLAKNEIYMQNLIQANGALLIYSIITTIGGIITGIFTISLSTIFLDVSKGGQFEIKDWKRLFRRLKESFILNILIAVRVFLWALLFIIPGIIKYFAYSMAKYIKAEHPEYTYTQAIKESEKMMNGFKGHHFGFMVSFIGWIILASVANMLIWSIIPSDNALLIVGNLLSMVAYIPVEIYINASFVNYYGAIKEERRKYEEFIAKRNNGYNVFSSFDTNGQNQSKPFESFDENKNNNDPFSGF